VDIIEVNDLSLDEWISLLKNPPDGKLFVRNMFPTDRHKEEWLASAYTRSEQDVKMLLRYFLVSMGSNPLDTVRANILVKRLCNKEIDLQNLKEHDFRLLKYLRSKGAFPVWEGIGWVLDLLPNHPRSALDVLDAFFKAYYAHIPDNYLSGLFDAQAVIRNRYIESHHTLDHATRTLLALNWRELEVLCAVVYNHMGYDTLVTVASGDDGVDVFADNSAIGKKERVVIQAKKWKTSNPVGKAEIRELLGTITLHQVTRGVMVTTGTYQSGAHDMAKEDSRLELLDIEKLIKLLNEYCGTDWFLRVDRLLTSIKLDA
jgi:restriction system protein